MITLVLEASTYEGSAALLNHGSLLEERFVAMRGREHEALMAAVGELLVTCEVSPRSLARIVCGAGPGSFTSLRIAGSIAKGLAMATHAPVIPVSSLTLLAASVGGEAHDRVLATLDAMRGESYVQLHGLADDGSIEPLGEVGRLPTEAVQESAERLGAVVIGPASKEYYAAPRASGARRITKLIDATKPADLAAWEPGYGRLAEAQVKWEAAHGRPLPA